MNEFLFENKEIINIIFGLAIGLIPTFFDLRTGKKNRKLNSKGWLLLFICMMFIFFSIFIIYQDDKRIKNDDIILEFSLRSPTPFANYNNITKSLPKEILAPLIEIEKSYISGIFKFQNIHEGKGHASESKFVTYTCYISSNKSIENFPKKIDDINPKNVTINISLKHFFDMGYTMNGYPTLILRNNVYTGTYDSDKDKIEFY